MKLYSYAPTTGDHTYELDSGLHMTYTLEQAIALGYPIAEQFKGQRFSVVIDPEWLPPAGDVRLHEDITEALASQKEPPA